MNFRVVRTSQEATSELMDQEKEMLMQYMMASITARLGEEERAEFQQKLENGEILQNICNVIIRMSLKTPHIIQQHI